MMDRKHNAREYWLEMLRPLVQMTYPDEATRLHDIAKDINTHFERMAPYIGKQRDVSAEEVATWFEDNGTRLPNLYQSEALATKMVERTKTENGLPPHDDPWAPGLKIRHRDALHAQQIAEQTMHRNMLHQRGVGFAAQKQQPTAGSPTGRRLF